MKNILLALLVLTGSLPAQETLSPQQTEDFLNRLLEARGKGAVQADFREEKRLTLMQKPVTEEGTVTFLPPDKFRREVSGKSLTVCDGEVLWLYYPEFQEAEKYVLASNRALRESVAIMSSGFGLQDLKKNFEVTVRQTGDGHQLTLVPRNARMRKNIQRVVVDVGAGYFAKRLEIASASGDVTVTTFSNERVVPAKAGTFTFQPPAGTSVSEPLR